jgi:hypothetical protein
MMRAATTAVMTLAVMTAAMMRAVMTAVMTLAVMTAAMMRAVMTAVMTLAATTASKPSFLAHDKGIGPRPDAIFLCALKNFAMANARKRTNYKPN